MTNATQNPPGPHRVVVVGGGFAGLRAVRRLRGAPVEVTLVDRQNFTLFQPLVYQVATGALSPAEIAAPLRSILRKQRNARVVLAEVTGFDLEQREIVLEHLPNRGGSTTLGYDTLIVAGGSRYNYFGHDEWRADAPELKSLAGALDIRSRILTAFEAAELEPDPQLRQALADLRGGRRRPHRRRDGGPDRRARARRGARRLPVGRHAQRRGCCWSRPRDRVLSELPRVAVSKERRARSSDWA